MVPKIQAIQKNEVAVPIGFPEVLCAGFLSLTNKKGGEVFFWTVDPIKKLRCDILGDHVMNENT